MVKASILFLVLCNIIWARSDSFNILEDPFQMPYVDYISNRLCLGFSEKMEKRGLKLTGIGGGEEKGKAKDIQICFRIDEIMDLTRSRKLIVDAIILFLEDINQNKEISNYLIVFPYTSKNVIVAIDAKCPLIKERNYIASVSSNLGKIYYYTEDEEHMALVTVHEETFEEAQNILKKQGLLMKKT